MGFGGPVPNKPLTILQERQGSGHSMSCWTLKIEIFCAHPLLKSRLHMSESTMMGLALEKMRGRTSRRTPRPTRGLSGAPFRAPFPVSLLCSFCLEKAVADRHSTLWPRDVSVLGEAPESRRESGNGVLLLLLLLLLVSNDPWRVPNPPGANPLVAERAPQRSSQSCVTRGQQPIRNPYRFLSFLLHTWQPLCDPNGHSWGGGSFSYQGVSTRGVRHAPGPCCYVDVALPSRPASSYIMLIAGQVWIIKTLFVDTMNGSGTLSQAFFKVESARYP